MTKGLSISHQKQQAIKQHLLEMKALEMNNYDNDSSIIRTSGPGTPIYSALKKKKKTKMYSTHTAGIPNFGTGTLKNGTNKKKKMGASSLAKVMFASMIIYTLVWVVTLTTIGRIQDTKEEREQLIIQQQNDFWGIDINPNTEKVQKELERDLLKSQLDYYAKVEEKYDDDYDEKVGDDDNDDQKEERKEDDKNEGDEIEENDNGSSFLTMYGDHRAIQSIQNLPGWLQDYIEWNRQQEQANNKKDQKYLVLMCLSKDNSCGGFSDRFRGLLFYLFLAKLTNRKLCFYWTRPFPLNTFFEPTKYGIDWRCPDEEISKRVNDNVPAGSQTSIRVNYFGDCQETPRHPATEIVPCLQRELDNLYNCTDKFAVTRMFGNTVSGINDLNLMAQRYSYVDMMPNVYQWQYPDMMENIFRALFKPNKYLAKRVNATMTRLGLVENEYVSVHVRCRYPVQKLARKRYKANAIDKAGELPFVDGKKEYLVSIMENAIQCGHLLAPDLPIYFASDHNEATKYAISNKFTTTTASSYIQPVGLENDKMPVHVGNPDFSNFNHSDYYSVFEDLLIMGGSKCVAHGIGSFGSFGAGLTGNKCRAVHRKYNGIPETCPNDRAISKKVKILDRLKIFSEGTDGMWDRKLKCNISEILEEEQ